jgi:HEAT repeat protein
MRTCLLLAVVLLSSGPLAGQADKKDDKKKDDKKARPEPRFQGRTIAGWVKVLEDGELTARIGAASALMQAGPEARAAVPALIKLLEKREPLISPFIVTVLGRIGPDAVPALAKALESPKGELKAGAASALASIGPAASPAAPALLALLASTEASQRSLAAFALGEIGHRPALPALKKALKDADRGVAVDAALALWKIGRDASGAGVLGEACASDDEGQALAALRAVAEIGTEASAAGKGVMAALKHRSQAVRLAAAPLAHVAAGKEAEALAAIEAEMKDKEAHLRAIAALGEMKKSAGAVARLEALLSEPAAAARREAAAALASGALDLAPARKALLAALDDPDDGARWWAAAALLGDPAVKARGQEERFLSALSIGPGSRRAEVVQEVVGRDRAGAALGRVLANHSGPIAIVACQAVAAVNGEAAGPELLKAFASDNRAVRMAAADAAAALGVSALPSLRKMLSADGAEAREAAARALGAFRMSARSAVPDLLKLLKDPSAHVRIQAALAAWRIDDRAEEALPVINLAIKDLDLPDRWAALDAIGTIAYEAQPPIRGLTEILVNGLKDRDDLVRAVSARWMWKRTKMGKPILPLLRDVAGSRDAEARRHAVEALAELEAEDGPVPLLVTALDDASAPVRVAAQEGLARCGDVKALVKALGGSKRVKEGAARALGMIGPRAKEALPELAKAGAAGAAALRRIFPGKEMFLDAYLEGVREGKDVKVMEKALLAEKP